VTRLVYIPYDVFTRWYKIDAMRKKKEIKPWDIFTAWHKLLEFYPRNLQDWKRLEQEYGSALKYNYTNWTPRGRVPRPEVCKRWLEVDK